MLHDTAIPFQLPKKMAVALQWLAHGLTEASLAHEYCLGESTVYLIVHEVAAVPLDLLLKDSIVFPTGQKLLDVFFPKGDERPNRSADFKYPYLKTVQPYITPFFSCAGSYMTSRTCVIPRTFKGFWKEY